MREVIGLLPPGDVRHVRVHVSSAPLQNFVRLGREAVFKIWAVQPQLQIPPIQRRDGRTDGDFLGGRAAYHVEVADRAVL